MARTLGGAAIGFMVGGVLGWCALGVGLDTFGESGSDFVQYAPLFLGPLAFVLGGVAGMVIGAIAGARLDE
jgi:hypothetical protein